ncbi:major myo-inositol transporter iolT [Colletotrichum plurivorum]|uniref:Major myo-inositol transporter iolT n=1 Tax=Colletotrichum plurivorum TaxID=2175906 RepID=A0A8H6NN13_9PEZI|nr:major myo-inositol transporter iolT [Colletotrichum plurivorum]
MSKATTGTARNDMNVNEIAATSEVSRLLAEDTTPWYRKKNLRRLYMFLIPSALGVEITTGFDGSVLNGLQAVDKWQEHFGHPTKAILGLVSASISIGSVLAVPAIPYFNDGRGRKFSVILGSFIVTAGVILQTVAVNLGMLIAARIIIGFGLTIALSGAAQLLTELCYPRERAIMVGIFQVSWYVGSILAAGTTLGTFNWPNQWSWRLPTLFQILPSALQIAFIWFVPESPRWLISKDRHEEALEILVKYHGEGDPDSAFVAAEFFQIRETLRLEKEASTQPWRELFTGKTNVRRVTVAFCVGLFSQWAGNGLVSYYLSLVLSTIGITDRLRQNQINLSLSCWNLATGATAASVGTNYLPRRWQLLIGFGSMCVIFSCWTAASAVFAGDNTNSSAATAVVALIFLYYAFYNLMMPLQYMYVSEVFPFIHRSKGIAIMQLANKGGTGFNQFVNPIGIANLKWRYYLVYVVIIAVETFVIWLIYPETKGVSLEEVAVVMEGDRAHVERVENEKKLLHEDA